MNRRTLFGKLAAIAAVAAVGPAVKVVKATPAVPSRFNADWEAGYLARQRVGTLTALPAASKPDLSYGQQASLELAEPLSKGILIEPSPSFEDRQPVAVGRLQGVPFGQRHEAQRVTSVDLWNGGGGTVTEYTTHRLPSEPPTFEAMQADCAARGCELVPSPISISQHPRTITHIDRRSRWAGYDYSVDSQENVLARVDVWRTALHGEG